MLKKFHSAAILLLPALLAFMACSKGEMASGGNTVAPLPADERFPVNLIIDSATVAGMQSDMTGNSALQTAYNTIIAQPAQNALSKPPEPFASVSSTNFSNISSQANSCKLLALQWLFLYKLKPA
ncbi:MAG: hypothetical protein MUF29_00120, partial [Chitinophagaceae bacterium]|nr:hypothetical protein [Chitinophagaceae bacterium]